MVCQPFPKSVFLGTFVKLGTHVLFFTTILIVFFKPEYSYSYIISWLVPQGLVFYLQLYIVSYIDGWMTYKETSGYSLFNNGYIWPTTANTQTRLIEPEEESEQDGSETERVKRPIFYIPRFMLLAAKRHRIAWVTNFLFPWIGVYSPVLLGAYPDHFGFAEKLASRLKYQKRFSAALGK